MDERLPIDPPPQLLAAHGIELAQTPLHLRREVEPIVVVLSVTRLHENGMIRRIVALNAFRRQYLYFWY